MDISPTNDHGQFSAIEVSIKNHSYVYAACDKVVWGTSAPHGLFWRSSDGGDSWTSISENHPIAFVGQYVTDIEINPFDENELWVSFACSNNGSMKVIHSTNGGDSWSVLSNNYPEDIPAHHLKYNYKTGDLYVGTDVGTFFWLPSLSSWIGANSTLPKIITGLEINETCDTLYASTLGYGIWSANIYHDCYSGNNFNIVSDYNFSVNTTICDNIVISNGANVNVTNTLTMAFGATITVMAGSRLNINGGLILNANLNIEDGANLNITNGGEIYLSDSDILEISDGSTSNISDGAVILY